MNDREIAISFGSLLSRIVERNYYEWPTVQYAAEYLKKILKPMKEEGLVSEYHCDKIFKLFNQLEESKSKDNPLEK